MDLPTWGQQIAASDPNNLAVWNTVDQATLDPTLLAHILEYEASDEEQVGNVERAGKRQPAGRQQPRPCRAKEADDDDDDDDEPPMKTSKPQMHPIAVSEETGMDDAFEGADSDLLSTSDESSPSGPLTKSPRRVSFESSETDERRGAP